MKTLIGLVILFSSFEVFAAKQNDEQLYVEVIKSFRVRNQLALKKNVDALVTNHPTSAFADNAIYLRGQFLMQNRQYTEAIREFQKLTEKYPRSNKVAAALFSKGQAYRKLNVFDIAQQTFKQVKKQFPGSPEADRCDLELKLVEVQQGG